MPFNFPMTTPTNPAPKRAETAAQKKYLRSGPLPPPTVLKSDAEPVYPAHYRKTVYATPPDRFAVSVPYQRIGTASWVNI